MARFSEQIASARTAHLAVNALEDVARAQIDIVMGQWDAGVLDARTVRFRLEKVIRDSYRGSVALAVAQVAEQAGVPGWKPRERVFLTPYLKSLLEDVRRNLREYKASGKAESARRRAILRMKHSAGVAAQRGFTDALVSAYTEMAEFGLTVRKIWFTNFGAGTPPCPQCADLHGTEVGISEEFPTGTFHAPYIDLVGPPAHPHCRCWLAFLVVSLENAFDSIDMGEAAPAVTSMTSKQVRSMPAALFGTFVKFVTGVVRRLRGKK